jgi:hypothetical protein
MRLCAFLLCAAFVCAAAPDCDLSEYQPQPGITATMRNGALEIVWQGAGGAELRADFDVAGRQPLIRELAARKGGNWIVLGTGLKPEFQVTTGVRHISEQQLAPLRKLGLMSPEYLDQQKWNAFWDAPLTRPQEVRHATAAYDVTGCKVRTAGLRIEVEFAGVTLGTFSGRLMFTVYKGTNLLREEVVAKTDEPSVAYKYAGGLDGFRIDAASRVVWRDTSRAWQKCEFGGAPNRDPVALRARNRLAIIERRNGSLAFFPPPHKFFFAREIELNLGYVWYRKDSDDSFSAGVRQGDREEMYRPYGVSDQEWEKRVSEARRFSEGNFALYNAPPGTWQRMAVYFYLSSEDSRATQQAVMAFTHDDTFKPLAGHQIAISHFHTHFHEMLADAGTIDIHPTWVETFRALGINIAMMSDFHGDGHPKDPGPVRLREQQTYFEGCRRHSDKEFLIMPGEEPDAFLGGHYTMVFPRPVYWTHVRESGQPLRENQPGYGKVYHIGSAADELEMLRSEGGLVWQAHPRTKGSSGYPDAVREMEHFRSDRFLGGSFQSLPVDLSQKRICETRCLDLLDDMNNWAGPKYMIAEGDTYAKYPDDETYGQLYVNYVKLPRLPKFDEDWTPVLQSMRNGDFFVTSGEVLLKRFAVEKTAVVADLEWTFPLDFVELVWGDGDKVDRKIIPATGDAPFGTRSFRIPFDPAGKKWIRFAAWDSAGNGALSEPVHLR